MEPGVHPLALNGRGAPARICQLHGSEEQRRFLGTLGFAPGCEVRVMNELAGDLIVEVKGTRVALGRQLAHKVMVV